MLQNILEKIRITKKFIQCEISCIFKIDVFEIPDKKNIGKLFSKNELLFLDHAIPRSDSTQIPILQLSIPRASLPPSRYLSNITLCNWNPSSTQFYSCSSSVSLFCPPLFNHIPQQISDIAELMPSQANQLYHESIIRC